MNIFKTLKLLFLICMVLFAVQAQAGAKHRQKHRQQAAANPQTQEHHEILSPENSGTKIKEIVHWEDLSEQYVLGYGPGPDPDQKTLVPYAVYDKTFSTPFYSHFWKFLLLGSLEVGDANLGKLTKKLEEKSHKKKSKKNNELLEILSSPEFSAKKYMSVEENFWKSDKIIWKEGKKPSLTGLPPLRIHSSDFDWDAMMREVRGFAHWVESYQASSAYLIENDEIPLNPLPLNAADQFQDLEFLWHSAGYYEVYFPKTEALPPVKVIDLKNKYPSLTNSGTFAGISNFVKSSLTLIIPIYGPPQFAAAQLERAFDLVEVLYLMRHAQALNLVTEAIAGNPGSPFFTDKLTSQDLEDSVFYLLRASTLLASVFKNIFTKNEWLVPQYLNQINSRRDLGIQKLKNKGLEVYPLPDSYFALGAKRGGVPEDFDTLRVYALSYFKFGTRTPMAAVDFLHPHSEIAKRNILQAILYGANFIWTPIPGLSSVIKLAYKELMVREVHRRQMWESALLAHIHHFPNELKDLMVQSLNMTDQKAEEYERLAIQAIEDARMNPLELDREDAIIHRRKVEDWIRQQDPSYLKWEDRALAESSEVFEVSDSDSLIN